MVLKIIAESKTVMSRGWHTWHRLTQAQVGRYLPTDLPNINFPQVCLSASVRYGYRTVQVVKYQVTFRYLLVQVGTLYLSPGEGKVLFPLQARRVLGAGLQAHPLVGPPEMRVYAVVRIPPRPTQQKTQKKTQFGEIVTIF